MPLKDRGKKLREFININHKLVNSQKYYTSLEHYSGNLLFVGISYDKKKKTHTCRIERFVKDD